MRAPRIPADEQFRLIMECRASGLTDHEWCLRNDINPRTFYNWVKRLRQKGCAGIPNAMRNPVRKTAIAIVNLPPRKMMGIDSEGMLISAVHEEDGHEGLNLLMVNDRIPAGAKLY